MSLKIKDELIERAKDFQIILDDVAITDTGFSPRFTQVNIPEQGFMDRQGSMDCQGCGQGDNFLFSLLNKNKLLNSKHFKPNTLFKKLNRPNKKRLLLPREMLKGNFVPGDLCWPQDALLWPLQEVTLYFSARLIGKSLKENPAYLKLQRIEYGKQISKYIAQGGNKVMLPSNNLLLDIQTPHTQYDKKQ